MITFISELTVRIILDDRHTLAIRQFHQRLPPLQAEGKAARVLKVGEDVNELGPDAQRIFQFIHDHAVFVRTDRDDWRATLPGLAAGIRSVSH